MNFYNNIEYKDLLYEHQNISSDKKYPKGIKCKNYELCENILPPNHCKYYKNYLCMTCGDWNKCGFGWNELEFINSNKECIICYKICNKQVKFPTNCGHYFCINCSKEILFWDESRYHLSPVPFGCPICPNGCINPIKGKQCYCEEYDKIQNKWKYNFPLQFKNWINAEDLSLEIDEHNIESVYGSQKCPLCRKKYNRL